MAGVGRHSSFPSPVRRPSSSTLADTLMLKDTTLGWKFAPPKISRLHMTLAELDFEYPTIKSLRAPNNSAIVLKNSNHNNRQSLICGSWINYLQYKNFETFRVPLCRTNIKQFPVLIKDPNVTTLWPLRSLTRPPFPSLKKLSFMMHPSPCRRLLF